MQGTLSQLQKITQAAVAHFVKETFITTKEQATIKSSGQKAGTPEIVLPMATIFWLYEQWRVWRGVSPRYQMVNQRTFSYVFTHLDVDVVGIHPIALQTACVSSKSITIPVGKLYLRPNPVPLIPDPKVRGMESENIGIASGPFDASKALRDDLPPDLARTQKILEKYLTRKNAKITLEHL